MHSAVWLVTGWDAPSDHVLRPNIALSLGDDETTLWEGAICATGDTAAIAGSDRVLHLTMFGNILDVLSDASNLQSWPAAAKPLYAIAVDLSGDTLPHRRYVVWYELCRADAPSSRTRSISLALRVTTLAEAGSVYWYKLWG